MSPQDLRYPLITLTSALYAKIINNLIDSIHACLIRPGYVAIIYTSIMCRIFKGPVQPVIGNITIVYSDTVHVSGRLLYGIKYQQTIYVGILQKHIAVLTDYNNSICAGSFIVSLIITCLNWYINVFTAFLKFIRQINVVESLDLAYKCRTSSLSCICVCIIFDIDCPSLSR